jgi:hypothetical protein
VFCVGMKYNIRDNDLQSCKRNIVVQDLRLGFKESGVQGFKTESKKIIIVNKILLLLTLLYSVRSIVKFSITKLSLTIS